MGFAARGVLLFSIGLVLGGCGQKGPLYLAPAPSVKPAPAPTTVTPSAPETGSSTR
jgi:predicted small lipoprotein YifL